MIPVIATEIEFYLFGSLGRDLSDYWQAVRAECDAAGIDIYKIEKETGAEQHEIALKHKRDVVKIIDDTEKLKAIVTECATARDMRASFAAKPLQDEPGSGLHVHVHLEDKAGNNLFFKQGEKMSDNLSYSIAGLLETLPRYLFIFAPTPASRDRFVPGSNAPTTVSWGANNRTVAVRLPDKGTVERHIEHRVAGADAEVQSVITAILAGMSHGIHHKLTPPAQVFGDASLAMYELPKLFPS